MKLIHFENRIMNILRIVSTGYSISRMNNTMTWRACCDCLSAGGWQSYLTWQSVCNVRNVMYWPFESVILASPVWYHFIFPTWKHAQARIQLAAIKQNITPPLNLDRTLNFSILDLISWSVPPSLLTISAQVCELVHISQFRLLSY